MKNCIKTIYPVSVDNDNLRIFDSIRMICDFPGSGSFVQLGLYSSGNPVWGGIGCTYKPTKNCHVTNGSGTVIEVDGEYTVTGSEAFSVLLKPSDSSKPAEFLIKGLSNITKLTLANNSYTYCSDVDTLPFIASQLITQANTFLLGTKGKFDASYITKFTNKSVITMFSSSLNSIPIYSTSDIVGFTSLTTCFPYSGDLSSLSGNTALIFINADNSKVTGNISSLGALTSLNVLLIYGTTIQGSIEDFVAEQVTAGRTSGQIKQLNSNGIITFGGNPVSAGHHSITWTSASDITVGNEYIP